MTGASSGSHKFSFDKVFGPATQQVSTPPPPNPPPSRTTIDRGLHYIYLMGFNPNSALPCIHLIEALPGEGGLLSCHQLHPVHSLCSHC